MGELALPGLLAAAPRPAVGVVADEVHVLAVAEAHVLAAGEDQGVVPGQVEGAGGGAEEQEGVVQHAAIAAGLGGVLEPRDEAAELLVEEAAVDAEVLPAAGVLRVVGQLVAQGQVHRAREDVAAAHAVLAADLVGGGARGVRAEGQVHQLVHGLEVQPGLLQGHVELEVVGLDLGQGDARPALRLLHPQLGLADRLEVLVQGLAVRGGEGAPQGAGVLQEIVEGALAHGEAARGVVVLLEEERVEDALGPVLRGDRPARPREGEGVSAPGGAR